MQGYGLTETSPVITTNTGMHSRLGTVGKPIRNVQIRIAEDGEIEVSGANVMLGYYNKPEATREALPPTAGSKPATSERSTPTDF
jgi:long-chain acyl-CoA synthetase